MNLDDIDAIIEGVAPVVVDLVAKEVEAKVKAWPTPEKGEPGLAGKDGLPGTSAFQLACLGGFSGSEADWLESLRGKDAPAVDVPAVVAEVTASLVERDAQFSSVLADTFVKGLEHD